MRTNQIWQQRIRLIRMRQKFPPRIIADLERIEKPKTINYQESLYLYGPAGSGKTIYSAWMLLEKERQMYLSNQEEPTYFLNTWDLFNEIKQTFDDPDKSEQDILAKYRSASLLVLDDFGVMKPTDWVFQILYGIINYRYEYNLQTVFTSNQNLGQIAKLFGDDRICSRIERMCVIRPKKPWKNA